MQPTTSFPTNTLSSSGLPPLFPDDNANDLTQDLLDLSIDVPSSKSPLSSPVAPAGGTKAVGTSTTIDTFYQPVPSLAANTELSAQEVQNVKIQAAQESIARLYQQPQQMGFGASTWPSIPPFGLNSSNPSSPTAANTLSSNPSTNSNNNQFGDLFAAFSAPPKTSS